MAVKVPKASKTSESPPPEFTELEELDDGFKVVDPVKDDIPSPPAKNLQSSKDDLFFRWIDTLTEAHWERVTVWLYRSWPIIDRQRVSKDNPKFLNKYIKKFSRDTIKCGDGDNPAFGSGEYQLIVNDLKGQSRTICTGHTKISDPNFPPIFRVEELVTEHPSNRMIVDNLVARGLLTVDGRLKEANVGAAQDQGALVGLVTRLVERLANQPPRDTTTENIGQMYVKASDSMMSMLKDQLKSDDPDKWLKMLTILKELVPKPENNSEMLTIFMKMQSDAQAREASANERMFTILTQKPDKDPELAMLEKMQMMREMFGDGGAASSKRGNIWETAIEHGAPVLGKIVDTISSVVNMKNYQAGLNKQANAAANPPAANNPAITQAEPNPEGDNVVEMPPKETDELAMLIRGPAGGMILGALQRGDTGDRFAESLEGMLGTLMYDKIAALGKESMLKSMQSVPEFWNRIVPSTMEKFIDEFIAYQTVEEEETIE